MLSVTGSLERLGSVPGPALANAGRGSLRSLDIAARSLYETRALAGGLASVVADGALDHHFAGLFQYAAIRVGLDGAARALEKLRADAESVARREDAEIADRPSVRLYRALRRHLNDEMTPQPLAPDAPEWWLPADDQLARRVIQLRRELHADDAEVLELCFARGLDVEDVADVLGTSSAQVERNLARGLALAERILGRPNDPVATTPDDPLLLAFVLDPRRARVPQRPPRKPVLEEGTVVGSRYEIEVLLGAGAFADVYRARDREVTDHVIALKIQRRPAGDARAVRAALRELQLIASVFHPSVVQLKDHGWHEGHLWFVMPLYRGETLAHRLQRGPLSRAEAREIFEPLAEALATMHRAGVRHQDIKPENVFLANIDPEGTGGSRRLLPVLLDLGVAAKDAELVLAGTPAYFAPEVASRFTGMPDPPPVGPKADVFALALTLRDALDPSHRDPIVAGAVDGFVSYRALHAPEPPRRRELRDLVPWFERWLHFSPDMRPSADEFRRELAVLTRPEERRARRIALMRWLLPTTVAIAGIFGTVVSVLSREAALRRTEAAVERLRANQAQEHAASIHATLEEEEARRRKLEADVARLEDQYQKSRLTREELAARLATVEGEFALLSDRQTAQLAKLRHAVEDIRELRARHDRALAELAELRERRDQIASELDRTKAALDGERGRRSEAEAHAQTLTVQLKAAEVVVADARTRISELEARVAAALEKAAAASNQQQTK